MFTNETPLRVLFISHDGGMAGAQQTLLTLLEGLDRNLFHPHLVVPYAGELAKRVSTLGIPVTTRQILHWAPCVAGIRRSARWSYLWRSLKSVRARALSIAALIELHAIDLVYTNTVICIEGALAARITGKPHVWHIHEPLAGNSELMLLFPMWFYSAVIRMLSTRIVFPSYALARCYPALHSKASIIHNGLRLSSKPDRAVARAEVAARLNIDPAKQWVAVVGAIQPRKDHYTFLGAAKTVLGSRDDVHFLIIGSGAPYLTKQLQEQVNEMGLTDQVALAGRWPGSIDTVFSAIDVLVISSEQESFGLTAIESLAVETPVVSTRCGGPEEIIEDGKNGYLVNVKDAPALGNAILALLNDPLARRRFGEAGREKVISLFTQELYVAAIQSVLKDVCTGDRHPSLTASA
ncbi:glycosyltransferase family 4 protein [Thiobacillus sp.]